MNFNGMKVSIYFVISNLGHLCETMNIWQFYHYYDSTWEIMTYFVGNRQSV